MNRSSSSLSTAIVETALTAGMLVLFLGTFTFPESVARLPRLIGGITLAVLVYSTIIAWVHVVRQRREPAVAVPSETNAGPPVQSDGVPRADLLIDDLEGAPVASAVDLDNNRGKALLVAAGLVVMIGVVTFLGLLVTSLLFLTYAFVVLRIPTKLAAATILGSGVVMYLLFGQMLRLDLF